MKLSLCRYFGDACFGLKSVMDGWFKLSRPSVFNDPFDCDGRADGLCGINPKYMVGERQYEQLKQTPLGLIQISELRDASRKHFDSSEMLDNVVRIMCMTKANSSLQTEMLLWSHYTNGGQGLRVHFRIPNRIKDVYEIRRVRYERDLPRCDLEKISRMDRDPEAMSYCDRRIWTKGKSWVYENEYRLRMFVTATNWQYVKKDDVSAEMYLRVPPEWITRVDLGPRSQMVLFKPLICDLKAKEQFAHIKFMQTKKDRNHYRYCYEEI